MKRLPLFLTAIFLTLVVSVSIIVGGAAAGIFSAGRVANHQSKSGAAGQVRKYSVPDRVGVNAHSGVAGSATSLLGVYGGRKKVKSSASSKKKTYKKSTEGSKKKTGSKKGQRSIKFTKKKTGKKSTKGSKKKTYKKIYKKAEAKQKQQAKSSSSPNKSPVTSTTVKRVVVTTTKPVATTTNPDKTTTTVSAQKVLFTYSGTSSAITNSFNVPPGGWTMEYSYTCNPADSLFDAVIYQGTGIDINDFGAKVANQGVGHGSYYYIDNGSFNIHVSDYKCSKWTIKVVGK